jgi:SpoVK/Ycf46/Vps4 family AAA+-type ATPase
MEVEKYLNTGATSGNGDSGTSSRAFGSLLSWLSDRTSPAFIIYTSNNHLALPVELIRKGRFDDLFWIDLPTHAEIKEIYRVVINKYKRDPKKFDIDELSDASATFTGAEIDNLFKDALTEAFAEDKEVTMKHLMDQIKILVPQSKTNEALINAMRERVIGRLRPAAAYEALEKYDMGTRQGAKRKINA